MAFKGCEQEDNFVSFVNKTNKSSKRLKLITNYLHKIELNLQFFFVPASTNI